MKRININGFSLIEIMIALALLAGVSLFVVKISKRGLEVKKTVNTDFEINQFYNHIGKLLLSKDTCEINIGGPGAGITPASLYQPRSFGTSHPLTNFKVPASPATVNGNEIYKVDGLTQYGSGTFTITKMEVLQDTPGNFGLHVSVKRTSKDAAGGRDLKRRIPLSVKLNTANDKIVSCHQSQDEQAQAMCEYIESHTWNPMTQKCEKDPVTNPITTYERRFTSTGTTTITNQDYCALSLVRFGDKYKDSSTQECDLQKTGTSTWRIKRWKDEARDLYCGVICFKVN